MTTLLDSNVLIALLAVDHVHHDAAEKWFTEMTGRFATCPISEGALVRMLLRVGQSAGTATALLSAVARDPRHEFWPDDLPYREVPLAGVLGHRQVTDAYLAHLARRNHGRLATFDEGLAEFHNDVADLVPSS